MANEDHHRVAPPEPRQSLREDISALSSLAAEFSEMPIDMLLQTVQHRQILIDRIQAATSTELSAVTKCELTACLERVAETTSAALLQLRDRVEEMRRRQGQLVTARSAVRGYDPDIRRENRTIHREA